MDRERAIGYYSRSFYAKRRFHDTLLQAPSNLQARMAELVDALGSGPSAGNGVEVRVLFRAPNKKTASAVFFRPPKSRSLRLSVGLERHPMQRMLAPRERSDV